MPRQIITVESVPDANTAAIAQLLADAAGLTLKNSPIVQFADQPIELERFANGTGFVTAVLAITLDAAQVAALRSLTGPEHSVTTHGVATLAGPVTTTVTPHHHAPVQHRDGKPAWCKECGLTWDFLEPTRGKAWD